MRYVTVLKPFGLGFLVGAMVLGIFRACSREAPSTWNDRKAKVDKLDGALREMAKEILFLRGSGKCLSNADCHVAGLGSASCKGLKDFIVYSRDDANEPVLLRVVDRFNETAAKMSNLSLQVNDCISIIPAQIHCIQNRCQPVPPQSS